MGGNEKNRSVQIWFRETRVNDAQTRDRRSHFLLALLDSRARETAIQHSLRMHPGSICGRAVPVAPFRSTRSEYALVGTQVDSGQLHSSALATSWLDALDYILFRYILFVRSALCSATGDMRGRSSASPYALTTTSFFTVGTAALVIRGRATPLNPF
jgi:hypothetical protein